MTHIPRIHASRLSSGLRGLLRHYEISIRGHEEITVEASLERLEYPNKEPSKAVEEAINKAYLRYDKARQALLRKLVRLENGTNEGDIEQLKRDFRKLAKAYVVIAANPAARDMFPNEWKLAEEIASHRRRL